MKEQTEKLLDKAKDTLEAADILLTNDKVDMAAGRANKWFLKYKLKMRGTCKSHSV
jgi:uncharacterized protein (UPF0332 family)